MARREGPPPVSKPIERKAALVRRPEAKEPFKPEPFLEEGTYEEVVRIILGWLLHSNDASAVAGSVIYLIGTIGVTTAYHLPQ